jgi:hypothetical protein
MIKAGLKFRFFEALFATASDKAVQLKKKYRVRLKSRKTNLVSVTFREDIFEARSS